MMVRTTFFNLQIATQTDCKRLITFKWVIALSNWLSFPIGWIQLFKLSAISIQIQHNTAIRLPIHPQPHLDWHVSFSLRSCFL